LIHGSRNVDVELGNAWCFYIKAAAAHFSYQYTNNDQLRQFIQSRSFGLEKAITADRTVHKVKFKILKNVLTISDEPLRAFVMKTVGERSEYVRT
ncbi:unnamed protein product, partial [Didymodactylos carnosus]